MKHKICGKKLKLNKGKMGRPPLDLTDQEKKERHKLQQKMWRHKNNVQNIKLKKKKSKTKIKIESSKKMKMEQLQKKEIDANELEELMSDSNDSEYENFNANDIKLLAEHIKLRPKLWYYTFDVHNDICALENIWLEVGAATKKNVNDCKTVWMHLRNNYLYEHDLFDWKFKDDLNFLSTIKEITISSLDQCRDVPLTVQDIATNNLCNKSDMPSTEIQYIKKETHAPNAAEINGDSKCATQLQFYNMWSNFDSMLQQLPAHAIEDINQQVTNIINDKIKNCTNM